MKITHDVQKTKISKDGCDTSSFMLTNMEGSFLWLSDRPLSKYSGFFLDDPFDIYRVIEDIRLADSGFVGIERSLDHVRRVHKDNSERIALPRGVKGMSYSLEKKAKIIIDLDCRKAYDMRSFGRFYDVSIEDRMIIVSFTKKTDKREDDSDGVEELRLFIAIKPKVFDFKKDFEQVCRWEEHRYGYDEERKDYPASRYIYRQFIINAKELLIGIGKTKDEAVSELKRFGKAKTDSRSYKRLRNGKAELNLAFVSAQDSLEKLSVPHEGLARIYAGLPWFFQVWSRDELVSLGALIRLREFKRAKEILMSHMYTIGDDGRVPNRMPASDLSSADAVGWLWKRFGDFLDELKDADALEKYISDSERSDITEFLGRSISGIEKSYKKDGFITNRLNETWMDTGYHGKDGRPGERIEIQALHLNMLHLMHGLTGDRSYEKKERAMKSLVVEDFWNEEDMLADGAEEFIARPNIFIAYYVYPGLLSEGEWKSCFDNVLDRIWLKWGGIASIDTKDKLFVREYSGIDNRSYHRGDSWYWINNLAAVCMLRNDRKHFKEKVDKIIKASSEEMLWHGAIGHCAEVSSASHLSSKGCLSQAWSAAMFIELCIEHDMEGS